MVYQILFDNTIIRKGGEFDNNDLPRVWHQSHYRDKHGELLQLSASINCSSLQILNQAGAVSQPSFFEKFKQSFYF